MTQTFRFFSRHYGHYASTYLLCSSLLYKHRQTHNKQINYDYYEQQLGAQAVKSVRLTAAFTQTRDADNATHLKCISIAPQVKFRALSHNFSNERALEARARFLSLSL